MRRFEFIEGTSKKFWEISLEGRSFTVRYGRIGAAGTEQTKSWPSEAKAKAEHDKLVAEKVKKGYVEVKAAKAAKVEAPAPRSKGGVDHRVKVGCDWLNLAAIFHPDDLSHLKGEDEWFWDREHVIPEEAAGNLCGISIEQDHVYQVRVTTGPLTADEIAYFGGQVEGRLHVRHGRVYVGDPQEYHNQTGEPILGPQAKARWVDVPDGLYRVRIVATDREQAPPGATRNRLPDYVFQLETVRTLDAVALPDGSDLLNHQLVPRLQPSPRAEEEATRRPPPKRSSAQLAAELKKSKGRPSQKLLDKLLARNEREVLEPLAALFATRELTDMSLDFLLGYAARAAVALGPADAYDMLAPHCVRKKEISLPHLRQAAQALGPDADARWIPICERALESDNQYHRNVARDILTRMGRPPAK